MYEENVDESGQSEDWRETLLMGAGDMEDQPIYQKDVEQGNLLELPEQETTAEPVQENPTEQSGRGSSQQEGGTRAVRKWISQARQSKTLLCHPVVPQDQADQKGPGDDLNT